MQFLVFSCLVSLTFFFVFLLYISLKLRFSIEAQREVQKVWEDQDNYTRIYRRRVKASNDPWFVFRRSVLEALDFDPDQYDLEVFNIEEEEWRPILITMESQDIIRGHQGSWELTYHYPTARLQGRPSLLSHSENSDHGSTSYSSMQSQRNSYDYDDYDDYDDFA